MVSNCKMKLFGIIKNLLTSLNPIGIRIYIIDYRLHRQGKLTLAKLNYGKVRSKQCYIVTVDPSSSDFPLDDQNNSLTPSLNVLVRVTTFSEKETGTEGKEDGEEDYFEDAQFLSKCSNNNITRALKCKTLGAGTL